MPFEQNSVTDVLIGPQVGQLGQQLFYINNGAGAVNLYLSNFIPGFQEPLVYLDIKQSPNTGRFVLLQKINHPEYFQLIDPHPVHNPVVGDFEKRGVAESYSRDYATHLGLAALEYLVLKEKGRLERECDDPTSNLMVTGGPGIYDG